MKPVPHRSLVSHATLSDNRTVSVADPPTTPAFAGLSVSRETTVDRVVAELRRAVFEAELHPGTALREVALADSLGVSRSTVREALAVLVADGLATRVPNKGTTVRVPAYAAIRDVTRTRTVIEVAGVHRWHEATDAERAGVRRTLEAYAAAARGRSGSVTNAELNETHLAFHRSLVALTGSQRLLATQDAVSAEVRLALASVNRTKQDAREQVASHARLLTLLESGELVTAAAELVEHIEDGERSMLVELGLAG